MNRMRGCILTGRDRVIEMIGRFRERRTEIEREMVREVISLFLGWRSPKSPKNISTATSNHERSKTDIPDDKIGGSIERIREDRNPSEWEDITFRRPVEDEWNSHSESMQKQKCKSLSSQLLAIFSICVYDSFDATCLSQIESRRSFRNILEKHDWISG
jgi:hypothetical protein